MEDSFNIIKQLKKAEEQIHYHKLTLTLRRTVDYTINLVNYLFEVVGTSHKLHKDLNINLLTSWDVPQMMMTTNPYKTIDKFYDEAREKAASTLFDLSLTHTIDKVSCNGDDHISIWIDESKDGDTNIDYSVVKEVLYIIEQKRVYWMAHINHLGRMERY